jgi:hypothetical protein
MSSITGRMEMECSSPSASFAENPPAAEDTRQHRATEGEKAKTQGKSGSSKALALSDTLFERMLRNADLPDMRTPAYIAELNAVDERVGTNTTQSKVFCWLVDGIFRLDRLLVQADKLTISINCCYWSIGVSCRELCKVR